MAVVLCGALDCHGSDLVRFEWRHGSARTVSCVGAAHGTADITWVPVSMADFSVLMANDWAALEEFATNVFSGNHRAAREQWAMFTSSGPAEAATAAATCPPVVAIAAQEHPDATVCLSPFRFVWDVADAPDPWAVCMGLRQGDGELGTLLLAYAQMQVWLAGDVPQAVWASVLLTMELEERPTAEADLAVPHSHPHPDAAQVTLFKCKIPDAPSAARNARSIMDAIRFLQSRERNPVIAGDPVQLRLMTASDGVVLFESGPCHVGWDTVMTHAMSLDHVAACTAWFVLVCRSHRTSQMASQILSDSLEAFGTMRAVARGSSVVSSFSFGPVEAKEAEDAAASLPPTDEELAALAAHGVIDDSTMIGTLVADLCRNKGKFLDTYGPKAASTVYSLEKLRQRTLLGQPAAEV
jgi:hypothetical protein